MNIISTTIEILSIMKIVYFLKKQFEPFSTVFSSDKPLNTID